MKRTNADQSVIVSANSIESADPYDIIDSNISFLNALQQEYFRLDELSQDGLRSYYVDYYLAELENGGFSQFVYNTGWEETIIRYVREGLQAIAAHRHLELFDQSAEVLDRIGVDRLEQFYASEYFGENRDRDILNQFTDRFYVLCEREDLIFLNANWLRSLPNLVVLSIEAMQAEVERRVAALPDRDARIAQALANEPRNFRLIRALCAEAGQEFSHLTAGDPNYKHNGQTTIAWHFITNQGKYYMVEADGKAMMFHKKSRKLLIEIAAPAE